MAEQAAATTETPSTPAVAPVAPAASGTAPETGSLLTAEAGTAPAEGSPQQPAKAEAPAEYADFKLPDGYKLEGDLGNKFKTIAKDLNLTQEQAQKLINFDAERVVQQTQALHKTSADWAEATRADKEIGGDKLAENVAVAQKALQAFGTPELMQLLKATGMGNNPEIIRAFYRAGKAISEDKFVPSSTRSRPGQRDAADALYPSVH